MDDQERGALLVREERLTETRDAARKELMALGQYLTRLGQALHNAPDAIELHNAPDFHLPNAISSKPQIFEYRDMVERMNADDLRLKLTAYQNANDELKDVCTQLEKRFIPG